MINKFTCNKIVNVCNHSIAKENFNFNSKTFKRTDFFLKNANCYLTIIKTIKKYFVLNKYLYSNYYSLRTL